MQVIDGYLIEEEWDAYTYRGEDIEENRKWFHIPWQMCFKKKVYKTKEKAFEAMEQMKKSNRNTDIYKNHRFRLIPIYKGEPEIIELQLK